MASSFNLAQILRDQMKVLAEELDGNDETVAEPLFEGAVPTSKDGKISKEDLFKHMDVNGDGTVDIVDFAAMILFHVENPQYLRQYMDAAKDRMIHSERAEYMSPEEHKNKDTVNQVAQRKY